LAVTKHLRHRFDLLPVDVIGDIRATTVCEFPPGGQVVPEILVHQAVTAKSFPALSTT